MTSKKRIDTLLFERTMAPSRERAQAYIMAGMVLANGEKVAKPGQKFPSDVAIRLIGRDQPFVSRGGLKLAEAIRLFKIDIRHKLAMDIGASTGGFTDCLLQHQAAYVFAVDSGYNQLDWKLVTNNRVKNLEKCNFRYLSLNEIGTFVDIIVIDVSFISLDKILGNCLNFLIKNGAVIALIKPQFEAGKSNVEKGGVVSNPKMHSSIIKSITSFAQSLGLRVEGVFASPIQGKKSGNQEFLMHLIKP